MDRTKQRAELHKKIWGIANDLRGAVEGWDFRNYVLGFLFYRFISEDFADAMGNGYAHLSDANAEKTKKEAARRKGYFILPSELFQNVRSCAEREKNIEKKIESIFGHIEESGSLMSGMFSECDPKSTKLGAGREERRKNIISLLEGIGSIDFGTSSEYRIDVFGDAYEYLISMYASNAGKVGGEYYSPQELSRLTALIGLGGRKSVRGIYDPASGSGSLLLQPVMMLGTAHIGNGVFGQDISQPSAVLSRMNMILHGLAEDKIHIAVGNTITDPVRWDQKAFDLIVSNPPFSISIDREKASLLESDSRFAPAGAFPSYQRADMAFVMHCLDYLADDGTAAIVCYPGLLYRIGSEKKIREYLIKSNVVDAVIQLPAKLFFGTRSPVCLLVLKKSRKEKDVLFADASSQFKKAVTTNVLTEDNIQSIYYAYMHRDRLPDYARLVSPEEIAEVDYNLMTSIYIRKRKSGCDMTLKDVNEKLKETLKREEELRKRIDDIVAQFPDA